MIIGLAILSTITIAMLTIYTLRLRGRHAHQISVNRFIESYGVKGTPSKTNTSTQILQIKKPSKINLHRKRLAFYLPLTIERLVMSVQSGLDIGPAIERLVASRGNSRIDNPCEELFSQVLALNQSGLTLEESLNEVSNASPLPTIRHTFSHLASAQRDGGEILRPLIELADAAQQAYQEEMDEEIAKLPIKATLPLILTFAGLLICMMTPPILQVLSLIAKSRTGGT